jgi:hypothetical protein
MNPVQLKFEFEFVKLFVFPWLLLRCAGLQEALLHCGEGKGEKVG